MRRILAAGAAVALAVATLAPRYISAQSAPPWTTFHGDSARDGISSATGPKGSGGTGIVLNTYKLGGSSEASPVVGADGTAYIGDDSGHFYAFGGGTSSAPKWTFPATGKIGAVHSTASLSSDGTRVFFATEQGIVYAVKTSDGSQLWTADLQSPINSSPIVSKDGSQLYVNTEAGSVYALKPTDGSIVWGPFTPGLPIPVSMALSPDGGTLYIPFANQQLFGIPSSGPQPGSGVSVYYLAQDASGTPAIGPDGNIYVPTLNGYMEQFTPGTSNPTSFSRSINGTGKPAVSTPTFANGLVIFGAGGDTYVHAWNAGTGAQVWQFATGAAVGSSPVFASGGPGEIIVGSDDGFVYALTPAGRLIWKTNVGTGIETSPAIAPDGSVWVGNGIGATVYHIGDFVGKASPTLSTVAGLPITVGSSATDTAALSGGFNPTGTVTFKLYGPSDPTCAAAPFFTSAKTVSGNGMYTSGAYTPLLPGAYHWVATYSGDASNNAATTACGDPGETLLVGGTIASSPNAWVIARTGFASCAGNAGIVLTLSASTAGKTTPSGVLSYQDPAHGVSLTSYRLLSLQRMGNTAVVVADAVQNGTPVIVRILVTAGTPTPCSGTVQVMTTTGYATGMLPAVQAQVGGAGG